MTFFIYDQLQKVKDIFSVKFTGIAGHICCKPAVANYVHAIIVMGKAETDNFLALILGFLAVILGTLNVVGGFVVTDRMLEMFKKKK